jgi:glycosyltransferase involved in cell wall biosynthesis
MKAQGHRVVLAASPDSQIHEKAIEADLESYLFSFSILSAPADFIRLRRLIKKLKPSVLNTHGNMDAKIALTAAWGIDIPCVVRSRHHGHPVSPNWYNKLLYRHFSHYIFTTADCISDQIVRDLDVPRSKVITIASGISPPEVLTPRDDARRKLQQTLDLPPDSRFIGSVSMLRQRKGHDTLIDAFHKIKDACQRHHLVLVGDGDKLASLKHQTKNLGLTGRVHFVGFQRDPWLFFRAFDCHILASIEKEGIPQTLLQAMYAGTPVIGTSVGGIPDIVSHGQTGLLVMPENPDQLAQAIMDTLQNDAQARIRSDKAFAFVVSEHMIESMGNKLLQLYHEAFVRYGKG